MKLIDALRVSQKTRMSLVGAGGKTSALISLSSEWPSICMAGSTAHLGKHQLGCFPVHKILDSSPFPERTVKQTTVFTGPEGVDERLNGISPIYWGELRDLSEENDLPLFLESDGSKMHSLKAPAEHEPPVPGWVNHVVVIVGISTLGKPLTENFVHRPQIFSKLSGLEMGQPVTLEAIEKVLRHPLGGLKNIPAGARRSVLVNQMDTLDDTGGYAEFCRRLLADFDSVVTAALFKPVCDQKPPDSETEVWDVQEKTAGVILAAGASSRMGQPKALLAWEGEPFVRACVKKALAAELDPVIVIAGQEYERIREALKDLPVQVVHNTHWQEGQSSSLRAAINSLPESVGGAVFQLVDQPHIPVDLIRRLITEHAETLAPVVIPEAGGRRANPVLFDRKTFQQLAAIQGDVGGRMIFFQFPIRTIQWADESILLDVGYPRRL